MTRTEQLTIPGLELPDVLPAPITVCISDTTGETRNPNTDAVRTWTPMRCVRLAFTDGSVLYLHYEDGVFWKARAEVPNRAFEGSAMEKIPTFGQEWTDFEECPWPVQHFVKEFAGEVSA